MSTTRGSRRAVAMASVVALIMLLPSCAEDEPAAKDGSSATPTSQELASALLTAEDLGEGWSLTVPDPEADVSGVVTDEMREMLPRLEFCEAAGGAGSAAGEAASALQWQAFRQLQLDTSGGEPTPTPTRENPPKHHIVFVQEFLLSGDEGDLEEEFAGLADGVRACWGQTEEYPDGETGVTEELVVPTIGDETIASREVVTEPGPAGRAATWDLRNVIARDGDVLVSLVVAEIVSPEVETVIGDAEVEEVLTTASSRLDEVLRP